MALWSVNIILKFGIINTAFIGLYRVAFPHFIH